VTAEQLRRAATIGGLAARQRRFGNIAVVVRSSSAVPVSQAVQVLAEGAVLANYEGTSYKTSDDSIAWLDRVDIRVADDATAKPWNVGGSWLNARTWRVRFRTNRGTS
jgi:hypothetical protein